MPTLKQCVNNVKKTIDDVLDDDLIGAREELNSLTKMIDEGKIEDEKIYEALAELVGTVNTMVKFQKRNTMLNTLAQVRMYRYMEENHIDAPLRGLEGLIAGVQSGKYGTRKSLERRMESVRGRYLGGFLRDLEQHPDSNALFLDTSPEMDKQINRALYDHSGGENISKNYPEPIVKLVELMHKYSEMARLEANSSGAMIGKLDNYSVAQTHDPIMLIRGRKNKQKGLDEREDWIAYMKQALDPERTFGKADPDEFLNKVYNNIITRDHKSASDTSLDTAQISLTGTRNIGRAMSKERVLHFKSADDWFDYNNQWGKKTVKEAYISGMMKKTNDIAMMQMLGPNPRNNLIKITEMIKNKIPDDRPDEKIALGTAWGRDGELTKLLDVVDGTANSIVPTKRGAQMAFVSAGYRGVVTMAMLGKMVLAMIPDLAVFSQNVKSNSSGGYAGGISKAFGALIESVGGTPEEKIRVARMMGIFQDSVIQGVGARFGIDRDFSSGMQRSVNMFMKLNGAAWWNDNLKMSAVIMFSSEVGDGITKGAKYADLNADLKRGLLRNGIGEHEWKVVSKMETIDYKGDRLGAPEGIHNISDDVIKSYLKSKDRLVSKRSINEARTELEDTLRSYYVDMAEYSVVTPDAKTSKVMFKTGQRGTFIREFANVVGLFKTFGVSIMQKSLGQEIFGRGYAYNPNMGVTRNALKALSENRNGELANVTSLMAGMFALGYGSIYLKDMVSGKESPDLNDPKTHMRALIQSGSLGLLGDFTVNQVMNNRYGHNPVANMIGPGGGTVNDAINLISGAFELLQTGKSDKIKKELWNTVTGHTPYQNHFLLRPVMDWALLYSVQEALNPGYLRRMEGFVKKKSGQDYYAPPSEGGIIGAMLK